MQQKVKKIQRPFLDDAIKVRLTSLEKAALKEEADLAGLTMSELVRRRYFGRPIIASADAVMVKELRRLGGLLKHIHNDTVLNHLHDENGSANGQLTAATLAEIKRFIESINRECRDR